MAELTRQPTCPSGHQGLQVRCVVDYPATLSADGSFIEPDLSEPNLQESGGTLGVDCGCWCEECSEWYWESDCVSGPM
jgi:hypothetical protein